MSEKPKCRAAVILGRMGKGKPKTITEEERQARRERAAYARSFKRQHGSEEVRT